MEGEKGEGEHFKEDSHLLFHAAEDTSLQLRAGRFPSRWTDSKTERKMDSRGIKRGIGEEGGRLAGVGRGGERSGDYGVNTVKDVLGMIGVKGIDFMELGTVRSSLPQLTEYKAEAAWAADSCWERELFSLRAWLS